jgi:hypothetical protein
MENQNYKLTQEQLEVFKKYNLPVNEKLAYQKSPNLIESLILSQQGKNGAEIERIMGQDRFSAAMANR